MPLGEDGAGLREVERNKVASQGKTAGMLSRPFMLDCKAQEGNPGVKAGGVVRGHIVQSLEQQMRV